MSYIGLPPKANFTSGLLDRFTSTTGTTVTLTNDISSENDIVVFVNFVKQDSTTYSVGGTGNKTLTLGGTLVSSDIVEVHYLNIVGQTVNPSANSVGSSQLTADSITGQTAETSIADDDTIIIHDTSASALRKMTKSNFVSGIGGTNTPAFFASQTGDQTVSHETSTKVAYSNEVFDVGGVYDPSTNYRFTPGFSGKSYIGVSLWSYDASEHLFAQKIELYKNGSSLVNVQSATLSPYRVATVDSSMNLVVAHNDTDYYEVYVYVRTTDSGSVKVPTGSGNNATFRNYFYGYKIIE